MRLDDGPVPLKDAIQVGEVWMVGGNEGYTFVLQFDLVLKSVVAVYSLCFGDLWCDVLVFVTTIAKLCFEFSCSVLERVFVGADATESEG